MLVVAYLLLGIAVLVGNGTLSGLPFALGSTALVLVVFRRGDRLAPRFLPWFIALAAVLVLVRTPADGAPRGVFIPLTLVQAALGIAALLRPRVAGPPMLMAALAVFAMAGACVIEGAPPPRIDVFVIQQGGAKDLEQGQNPYAATFPNVYTKEETRAFFRDDRTELREYPYPPLSLLATTAGHRLGGDVRWTLLVAQLASAILLYVLARGSGHDASIGLAVTTLFLLHPRGLFVLDQSWTEPMLASASLGVLVLLQRRRTRWLGAALALFFGFKQYSVVALPLLFRDARVRRQALVVALLATGLVALPFVVWSPADFVNDVVLFQVRQPFRDDSLSLLAFLSWVTGWRAPGGLALLGAAAAIAFCWPRVGAPASPPSRLPLATALAYLGFFLFAKQAFCNYYYFVSVLVLAAAALLEPDDPAGTSAVAREVSEIPELGPGGRGDGQELAGSSLQRTGAVGSP